jgi:filamentous hemagglutinin
VKGLCTHLPSETHSRLDDGQQYDHLHNDKGADWDWQSQAPNGGAVPGSTQKTVIKAGDALDRYGSREGAYLSPADTPFEQRALPPGKLAEPYEKYTVLKEFSVVREEIAPAFNQPGGGLQLRAQIPEVENRYANISDLIKFGYLKDPKGKP